VPTDLSIVLIPLLAVIAPLLSRFLGRWMAIPVVVFELVLGIVVGPDVLGWAHPDALIHELSQFGLAMLFFIAGTEIDFTAFRGRTGRWAVIGWLISLVGGIAVGFLLAPGEPAIIIGIALCSTALGTVLPILRDAGELKTPFGRAVGAVGAVGEFGPLIAISLFLGGRSIGVATIVLGAFLLIAVGSIFAALRAPQGRLHRIVNATLHTSAQFAIRVLLLILAALVVLSIVLGLDMLLGAFTAGVVWRLMMRDAKAEDRDAVESKIEAIGFGFFVPVFFIYTGVSFDLASLIRNPILLALLPAVLVALFVVRGLPSMLAAEPGTSVRQRFALAFFGATALPIIVAVTGIGVEAKILTTAHASLLVGAGMLSVLVFPLIGMGLRGEKVGGSVLVHGERL
jgi:Kef-type K+ transport system membrane component KefB